MGLRLRRRIPEPTDQRTGFRVYYGEKAYTWHKTWGGVIEKYGPRPSYLIVKVTCRGARVVLSMSGGNRPHRWVTRPAGS